jgi:hypothetical protein
MRIGNAVTRSPHGLHLHPAGTRGAGMLWPAAPLRFYGGGCKRRAGRAAFVLCPSGRPVYSEAGKRLHRRAAGEAVWIKWFLPVPHKSTPV